MCANLRPCIYLGSSLQQQSHHVTIPTFGRYVQRRYVILEEEEKHRDHTAHRPHVVSSSRGTSTAVQLHTSASDSSTLSPQTHTFLCCLCTYPRLEVHSCPSVEQECCYVDVSVVSCNVERSEAALKEVRDTRTDREEQNQSKREEKKKGLPHNEPRAKHDGTLYTAAG